MPAKEKRPSRQRDRGSDPSMPRRAVVIGPHGSASLNCSPFNPYRQYGCFVFNGSRASCGKAVVKPMPAVDFCFGSARMTPLAKDKNHQYKPS